MKKLIIVNIFALLITAFWGTLGALIPHWLNVFFLPPMIIFFGMQSFRFIERLMLFLVCGFIVDSLGGFTVGINMFLMVAMGLGLSLTRLFHTKIVGLELGFFVLVLSFSYRLFLFVFEFLFVGGRPNLYLLHLLIGPIIDTAFAIVVYALLFKVLLLFNAAEQRDANTVCFGSV